METIRNFLENNNTCVMALIMIYENNRGKKKVYRVLSCVVYSFIDNYVFIGYISCKSKTLSSISSKPTFEQTSLNILLGIEIPELLLKLVSCHGFKKKPNSTVILNSWSCLVNNYLEKGFYIIEKDSNQLSFLPNDVKLRINLIDQMDTDFFMSKNKAISSVANTIKNCIFRKICIWFTNKTSIRINKRKYMTFLLNTLFQSWTIFIILCLLKNGNKILMLLIMKKSKPINKDTMS